MEVDIESQLTLPAVVGLHAETLVNKLPTGCGMEVAHWLLAVTLVSLSLTLVAGRSGCLAVHQYPG